MPAKISSRAFLDHPKNSANPCRTGADMGEKKGFRKISDEEIEVILKEDGEDFDFQLISEEELNTILEQHAKWLKTKGEEGEQANLRIADLGNRNLEKAEFEQAKLEGANLAGANLTSANLFKANLSYTYLAGANISRAILFVANLSSAYIAKANLSPVYMDGANLSYANLHEANLSFADLNKSDFSSTNLYKTNFSYANLKEVNLSYASLHEANLRGCDLRNSNLQGADLAGAVLAEARLNHAEFRVASWPDNEKDEKESPPEEAQEQQDKKEGAQNQPEPESGVPKNNCKRQLPALNLHARQLAGADLANAGLPDHVWQGFKDGLANVAEATKKVDKLFVGLLAGCAYFALVLALLNPGSSVKLPIINTLIPQNVFFWAAPLGVLLVYLYFQLNLQRLWERLAGLPAIFEDGTPLDKKASPWLIVGYVRAHFHLLREVDDKPPLSWAQTLVIQLLVWWSAPATLVAIWLRYLHDSPVCSVCAVQILATMAVMGAALVFLAMARRTLRLENQVWPPVNKRFQVRYTLEQQVKTAIKEFFNGSVPFLRKHWWRILTVAAVGAAMAWYSWHVISQQVPPAPVPVPPSILS